MKLNRIAMAALLAAPLAIPAHALVTVTPLLGFYKADEPQGVTIDDGLFAGLSAGLQFFPSWSFEAEYGKSGDTKLLSGNVLVYPSSWSFGRVSPYILAGVSQSKLDYKAGGPEFIRWASNQFNTYIVTNNPQAWLDWSRDDLK